ncbi:MAG: V-type proton ATPase subunit E [Actinomycetia bacterium]|nr:V-type proton ATPase subunit E [Actinomycetes bacterium]
MAIEEILAALDTQAHSGIDQVTRDAQAERDKIVEGLEQEAAVKADAYVAKAIAEANRAAASDYNVAIAATRRAKADVRREVFEEVFDRAAEKIAAVRSSKEYPSILSRLIAEASEGMGEGYVLHIDPRDEKLIGRLCPDTDYQADIETLGGVVVTSADGRIRGSSTFEDRLKRVQEDRLEEIAQVLGV